MSASGPKRTSAGALQMSAFGGKADMTWACHECPLETGAIVNAPGIKHLICVLLSILIGQSPVFAQTFRTYNCYDRSQFILAFFEGDKRAHLQLDGKTITLTKRMALSGSRYAKGDISLRITKTVITLKRGKQSTECVTRSW